MDAPESPTTITAHLTAHTPKEPAAKAKDGKNQSPKKDPKKDKESSSFLLLHLIIEQLGGATGSNGVDWKSIGETLGTYEGSEQAIHPEATRSRYRNIKSKFADVPISKKGGEEGEDEGDGEVKAKTATKERKRKAAGIGAAKPRAKKGKKDVAADENLEGVIGDGDLHGKMNGGVFCGVKTEAGEDDEEGLDENGTQGEYDLPEA